ncbi:hypothetical protein X777_01874 [Ooceraea biroi]|uniref:Mos1 transposase HTH domain-containing protein n=1 Tax=Ooceraea biroi TaxID=2015173 RepID=A0A026WR69_OOCBI|nr:hypothetical protein X777_01874 [Ooceraea biroi]
MIQEAFKEEALSRTQVYEWFRRFREGRMSLEDDPRSGRPSTSHTDENVDLIRQTINQDRRMTIDMLSENTGISWSACQRILTDDLKMRRIIANSFPDCSQMSKNKLVFLCVRI